MFRDKAQLTLRLCVLHTRIKVAPSLDNSDPSNVACTTSVATYARFAPRYLS